MNVMINSVHFKADRKLESFIREKLDKMPTFFDGVIGAEVVLKLINTDKPENKEIEIRLVVRGDDLFARKQAKTFEEATDTAIDALRTQIVRYKERVRGK
ncbi:MAG: ribosome-associated translation inhibitor RaiA [Bacteroidota bacterium]|nr:ribosome-associated translation inhibitor RaiA [Bacteroidota bacterium]